MPNSNWAWPWWGIMVAINIINFIICLFIIAKSKKTKTTDSNNTRYRKAMGILGLIYVSVALYRSCCVSSYPNRLVWFNSMANSPIVIRCIALFAEVSFASLLMLALLHLNKEIPLPENYSKNRFSRFVFTKSPYMIFACLFIAQFFAFSGLFTQYLVLFAVEETLWTLGFLSITPLVLVQCKRVFALKESKNELKMYRIFLVIMAVFCIGYLLYQFCFSLPFTYYTKLNADFLKTHPTGIQAINDAVYNYHVTHDYATWGGLGFFIWHSGYFSICVWMVLFFMSAPRRLNKQ